MKDGKLFGKISIIDIAAVILICAVAAGVYLRFGTSTQGGGSGMVAAPQKFEYVLLVESVRIESIRAYKQMGSISDGKTREYLGEIVDVKEIDATSVKYELANGQFVDAPQPGKYHAYITVQVNGKANETGYFTGGNRQINVGSQFIIETKYARSSAEIISINTL